MGRLQVSIFIILLAVSNSVYPCTVFFVSESPMPVVAKNMDWPTGQGLILINKRGVQKRAAFAAPRTPLVWVSRFMSLTYNMAGRDFPSEGMNEAGLSVNILSLAQPSYPPPPANLPVITRLQWVQYILDTSGNLAEAFQNAEKVGMKNASTHYFICDATSQCATYELINGQPVIHTGMNLKYKALANSTYEKSNTYLQDLLSSEDGKTIVNTPSNKSLDRFSRAAIFSTANVSNQDSISYAFTGLENVAEHYSGPIPAGTSLTQWNMVFDLQSRTAYLKTRKAPKVKVIHLSQFAPSCSANVRVLDMNSDFNGDVTSQFQNYTKSVNDALIEIDTMTSDETKTIVENYPAYQTKCLE